VSIDVVAAPSARRSAVRGERSGALRIAVTAPPEKGKANDAIQELLAERLGCKRAQITLVAGSSSRQKRFLIRGVSLEELKQRLERMIASSDQSPASG
jgi:uncharacterized protein (TIGR00251 family)